eukprot:1972624-Amphidinium_carterae.1
MSELSCSAAKCHLLPQEQLFFASVLPQEQQYTQNKTATTTSATAASQLRRTFIESRDANCKHSLRRSETCRISAMN